MTGLRLGTATADITPPLPASLAGFAARTEPAQGVSHPLRVRVAVFESRQEDGSISRSVLAVADLLWWGSEQAPALRQDIADLTGTEVSQVLLSATHTHSGPQTSWRASAAIGVADASYLALLRERTLHAAREAVSRLDAVTLQRWDGTHDWAFNRRFSLNPHGPVDPALTVIRAIGTNGDQAALFVHFACHPVITQEALVSSEFCGVAMDRLEADLGGTAFYLQGCCGDINPSEPGGTESLRGTKVDVERVGQALAASVQQLVAQGVGRALAPRPLTGAELVVDLPFAHVPTAADWHGRTGLPGVEGEVARTMLNHPEWCLPSLPLLVQRLDLAEGWSLLAMTGEVVVDYGLQVRSRSGDAVLPMGYANGMTGYIPTARILSEGGYEATGSTPYFFLPAPFAPEVEDRVRLAIDQMVPHSTQEASPKSLASR